MDLNNLITMHKICPNLQSGQLAEIEDSASKLIKRPECLTLKIGHQSLLFCIDFFDYVKVPLQFAISQRLLALRRKSARISQEVTNFLFVYDQLSMKIA